MPHRHNVPSEIEPVDDISICVPIPNHPDYIGAFLWALRQLTTAHFWQQPDDLSAVQVRRVMMDRTFKPVLDLLDSGVWCGDSDDCIEYPPNNDDIITYAPQDPFTQPGHKPPGYILPPFIRFADFLPDMFLGFAESLTGYAPNDVLTVLGSLPIDASWDELDEVLVNGLPRFSVNVSGKGRLLIHFLSVPFGGRALVSIDIELNPGDIIDGLLNDGFRLIELERDLSSFPPEIDIDHIEEIEFDEEGAHTVYVQFLPIVDDAIIPVGFGGGLRKVEWCGKDVTDIMIDCEYINDCIETNPDIVSLEQITVVIMTQGTEEFLQELEDMYVDSPTDINPLIPTVAPDAAERNALCHAICAWLRLYCEAKKTAIRQSSFLSQSWNALQNAIVDAYGLLNNVVGFIVPDGLFSCFVSNAEALTALSDTALIDDLICCLYDELDGITLLQGSLAGALAACSGNDLVCLLQNDMSLQHELNFFYIYGRTLERQNAGTIFDCPCEDFGQMYIEYDFTVSNHGFYSSNGTWQAGIGWVANVTSSGSDYTASMTIFKDFVGALPIGWAGGFVYDALSNCGIEQQGWAIAKDEVSVGFGQIGVINNGDDNHITWTRNTAVPYAPVEYDRVAYYGTAKCCGCGEGKFIITKARMWIDDSSPIKGIPSDTYPQGLGGNGSSSLTFWES